MTRRKKVIASISAVVILGTIITIGASQIYPTSFNKAKNSVVNIFQNFSWGWTGFSGKTFWDVLELISKLAIPLLIACFTHVVQKRDKEKAKEQEKLEKEKTEKQAELEREIAKNNLAEEAIQAYLDNMAKLLLDKKIRKELFPDNELKLILNKKLRKDKLKFLDKEDNDNPVRDVARTQTITILRRLEGDTKRQERIINFLRDAELYQFIFQNANLSKIDLSQAKLSEANLRGANLEGANLRGANLQEANLRGAYLRWANLQGAELVGANLQEANLFEANLQGAYLVRANLQDAYLGRANLQGAKLSEANLQGADLGWANVKQTNLYKANLQRVDLWEANLQETYLEEVENLEDTQIKLACFWDKAIYKGKWNEEKQAWITKEPNNTKYIEELKEDTASDPKRPPNCSHWKKEN